ncbi:MAG: heterocyst frequency control protein PatD [Cyanobacteria bacterium P01_H01_bin.58]
MPNPSSSALPLLDEFVAALETCAASVSQANVDGRSLQAQFLQAQQLYQQGVLPTLRALPSETATLSYQTEINRALRLLGMDVTFLQAAKNTLTVQKRQQQMQQRLNTLLAFSHELRQQL